MKLEVKKVDATRRELKFQIPKDRVSKKMDEVFTAIGREAKIKGFRPGKAPRAVIESQYKQLAHEEMLQKIIPEVYEEGIAKENLSPIDLPEIVDIAFKDGSVSFTAKLDIRPDVQIKSYKGIKVIKKDSQVTDEEMNKVLEFFKKGQEGQAKDKNILIDDEFAKGLGYPSLEVFKESIKRQMQVDKDRQNRMDIENQIAENLIKNTKIHVPKAIIEKQVQHRMKDLRHRMEHQGLKKEDIEKREKEAMGHLQTAAEKDIKLFFILEKIAELENIKIQQGENLVNKVFGFLFKEAVWQDEKPQKIKTNKQEEKISK